MKLIIFFLISIIVVFPTFAQAGGEEDTVRNTTKSVLQQLNQNRERLEKEPDYIQAVVSELIVPHFDFRQMSELVMGKYYHKFDDAEHSCFVSGFKNLLVERYAYILLSYDNQNISYEPTIDIGEKGFRLVRQTISREDARPLPIEYAMEPVGSDWKVVDIVVDGVSLVRAHRGMFQSRIFTQGRDYFINTFPECKASGQTGNSD